jgi:hypothetical protein
MVFKIVIRCIFLVGIISHLSAQQDSTLAKINSNLRQVNASKLDFQGYGVVNYFAYDWQTLPDKRNALDPERLNMYIYYNFTDKIQFKSEIEFEHGGTGATMSFDPLEEFGEFEQEVAKGGEVIAEQINILFKVSQWLNVRVGKMRFYMGNASRQDRPRSYFTAYRSEVENTILPLGWYETGIEVSGDLHLKSQSHFPYLSYKAYIVSGLDNTGFSSQNWIRRGYQKRFETINADNLAYAVRVDYNFKQDSWLGFNIYTNNATGNRPKNDFKQDSWVTYGDLHFSYDSHPWRARAFGMLGYIQNSEALSKANQNLSNNLNVKRTPVSKTAGGAYAELAYDILPWLIKESKQEFYLFSRVEWYDAMLSTEGVVFDNPRYERKIYTIGINYFPMQRVVLKSHWAFRSLGSGENENTFALGLGFDF